MVTRYFHLFCKERHKILAVLMPREVHANVNMVVSIVECLRELDEREAKHDEC